MIVRRKHTANFTTIGNVLFEDERLALDEVGLMSWLLSRPNDWEVRRPQLRARFKLGRDGMRRIMRSLLRLGWVRAEVTRLSDGRVHVIYEVRDEPGPELSDDQAKAALSLVSSGVVFGDPSEDEYLEDDPQETDADPGGGQPYTGQPGAANRPPSAAPRYSKDSLNTDSEKTESTKVARGFSGVIGKWPPEHILSRVTAEAGLASLTDKDFIDCDNGIEPYLADRRAAKLKLCDLTTFIRERRWERFSDKAAATGQFFAAKPYTPQWYRWREYYVATGQSVSLMDERAKAGREVTTPAEWPPPMPKKDEDSSAA